MKGSVVFTKEQRDHYNWKLRGGPGSQTTSKKPKPAPKKQDAKKNDSPNLYEMRCAMMGEKP